MTEQQGKPITLAEVQKHRSRSDLWVAVHGKVYNVSTFLYDVPSLSPL